MKNSYMDMSCFNVQTLWYWDRPRKVNGAFELLAPCAVLVCNLLLERQ